MTTSKLQPTLEALRVKQPFCELSDDGFKLLEESGKIKYFEIGEKIIRHDEFPPNIYLLLKGEIRLLAESLEDKGLITIEKKGVGQLFGWISLLRGETCETIQASEDVYALAFPSEVFIRLCKTEPKFLEFFERTTNAHETWRVFSGYCNNSAKTPKNLDDIGKQIIRNSIVRSLDDKFNDFDNKKINWLISGLTEETASEVGCIVRGTLKTKETSIPLRILGIPRNLEQLENFVKSKNSIEVEKRRKKETLDVGTQDLIELGIREGDNLRDRDKYPFKQGKGTIAEGRAVMEMLTQYFNVPFRKELCNNYLGELEKRGKKINLDTFGAMCLGFGLDSQVGVVKPEHLLVVDYPAIEIQDDKPKIIWGIKKSELIISDPVEGLVRDRFENRDQKEPITLLLVKKSINANSNRFGWSWFTPLVKKYKWALLLVFGASLLAQMMGLAIPLLLQQIIDKVLNQGNVSTLNVLGATMVILALFQGLLTGLRQFIFVDTTDRMDLTLGSAVIDRLLNLPLRYFERRPVGELSQRLGELNTIRGFLTGTALISVMNLLFAALYLIVMFIYSPLLTAIALSTFPVYMILVLVVAPIYKKLIRKKAVASAQTQSHLIEVLTGIQTVKAQNMQLTARWKWQERYRQVVNQGFRAITVGVATSQIGSFLTQLSGLMVIWIGMLEILNGNLTLGQLIAFRIIAGNVTGPLLQLSTLWQGFQGVQLSMERLSDIINQNAEQSEEESKQIALPPILGDIEYSNVSFRFASDGPYQVNDVNLKIDAGSFIGIAGQSGSGKSTLMKLLPRLYNINKGSIKIDGYDISKVELGSLRRQIGIVPQDSLLFEGTIADNIALNDPTIDDNDIISAASIACAHEFIMELPLGYATPLAERGSNLSGGQRQRIAIARTILTNPKLLIMDEATSALDYETERLVCLNLQEWAEDRTVLFITHRLSTIRNSDKIILMKMGKIVEEGTHDELMKLQSQYATLYGKQGDN